jgi:hypothetical protein
MADVTLIDGRVVDSASPEWRAECLKRATHMRELKKRLDRRDRDGFEDYLKSVQETEGREARKRLAARFKVVHAKEIAA